MVINWDRMLGCGLPVHVAGVGVLVWHQVHAGSLVQLGETWVRFREQSFGWDPLLTTGGRGHCSLGSQFGRRSYGL